MGVRRIESFLLRLVVQDDNTTAPKSWRGRIQHIATGEEQKIDQIHDAVTFITTHLGRTNVAIAPSQIDAEEDDTAQP